MTPADPPTHMDPAAHRDPATHTGPATHCEHVTYRYPATGGPVVALDDVDFAAVAGAITVIAGPSGSGKSTLLRLLAGIECPSAGCVTVHGVALDSMGSRARRAFRRRHVGYLQQSPADNLMADLTAADHLRHAAAIHDAVVDVDAALAHAGLGGRGADHPAALSGGEQQRLALACAIVAQPAVILADEPSAHLDSAATRELLDIVEQIANGGATVIIASHDPEIIDRATAVAHLDYGRRQHQR